MHYLLYKNHTPNLYIALTPVLLSFLIHILHEKLLNYSS